MQLCVIINCAYSGRVSQVSTLPLHSPGIDDCCWGRLPLGSQKSILLTHDLDSQAPFIAASSPDQSIVTTYSLHHGEYGTPFKCSRTQTEQWTWRVCSDDYASQSTCRFIPSSWKQGEYRYLPIPQKQIGIISPSHNRYTELNTK